MHVLMRAFGPLLTVIAALGWTLSTFVNVAAIYGALPLGGAVWSLHIVVLLLAIPATSVSRSDSGPWHAFWTRSLRGCPSWALTLMGTTMVYAVFNFVLFYVRSSGPRPTSDMVVIRGFSGHWMAFYAVEFAVFLAYIRRAEP